jgi:hypothetical protein
LFKANNSCLPGLPDGIISNQKYQFWYIFEGFGMKNVGMLSGHLLDLYSLGLNVRPFRIFCGPLVYISTFWHVGIKKNLATLLPATKIRSRFAKNYPR